MTWKFIILGASLLWIAFCMRFWYAIDRENVWQRRMIAIGAGVGGGLIYLIGTMTLALLKEHSELLENTPAESEAVQVRSR